MEPSPQELWKRGQRGWPASYPVAQLPNAPLLVALVAWAVAVPARGAVQDTARATFYAALAAWAWGELAGGANAVRRTVGAAGLVLVVIRIAEALRG